MKKFILPLIAIVLLTACSPSTKMVKTWKEPGASITPSPTNKTLVIGLVKDETARRVIEDQLVARFNGRGVASYTVIPPVLLSKEREGDLKARLKEGNYSHVLMMHLFDVAQETRYVPGGTNAGYYGSYGSYYGFGYGYYSDPGYYTTDKNYYVETSVYSVEPDKLLWTGTSKSINPERLAAVVNEIADVVTYQMKKDGFLK
jgi:hypothetical protein